MPRAQRVRQRIAQLRANGRTQEALELARQEAERGGKALAEGSRQAASAVNDLIPERDGRRKSAAKASLDRIDPDEGPTISEIGARVERASEARAPVDVGLSLTGNPRSIESFASSGMAVDAGGTGVAPERGGGQSGDGETGGAGMMGLSPGFVTDVGLDSGRERRQPDGDAGAGTDDQQDPLSFDDPFGVGGDR